MSEDKSAPVEKVTIRRKMRLRNTSISFKIFMVTLGTTMMVLLVSGIISFMMSREAIEVKIIDQLTSVREIKGQQIESYIDIINQQIITLSENPAVRNAMYKFGAAFDLVEQLEEKETHGDDMELNLLAYYRDDFFKRLRPNTLHLLSGESPSDFIPKKPGAVRLQQIYISDNPHPTGMKHQLDSADDSLYSRLHKEFHPFMRSYLEKFGYYDIFLINHETGDIVYSVFKEVDFATSLLTGPYNNTNFSRAFKAAANSSKGNFVKLVDFEPYYPSYNAPASFIASPIFDGDRKIGVLVFQMPVDRINSIMTSNQDWKNVGLGESGETYIVGEDFTMRTQSRFLIEEPEDFLNVIRNTSISSKVAEQIHSFESTIGLLPVHTEGTKAALDGQTGTAVFPDYRDVPVFSSFRPLMIEDVNWVIMSEINQSEALAPIEKLKNRFILTATIFIAIGIYVAFVFSRSIVVSLKGLATRAESLAKGDLEEPVLVESGDEIGLLAKSFEGMRQSIQKLVDDLKGEKNALEDRVSERTRELEAARDEADEAREAAEEANRAKSAFLLNMSHELRTPMNHIIGYSEMLAEDAEDDGNDQYIDDINKIRDSGEHLLGLLNDILNMSKIEAGQMDMFLETFSLSKFLQSVVSSTRTLVENNGNKYEFSALEDMGEMHADLTKVRQCLFNLVSNAAKFTKDGTITLSAEWLEDKATRRIRFAVSDTGIGIEQDKFDYIFKEFAQADESTTRDVGGTGMGLALVKSFCDMMGGKIWVESVIGEGSSFIFELPETVIDPEAGDGAGETTAATSIGANV